LLDKARAGETEALGHLLQEFRPYVCVIIHAQRDRRLNSRLDDSDLVQDVMTAACRRFGEFRGKTSAELAAWLRRIALGITANAARDHLGTERRDVNREQALGVGAEPADSGSTPSAQAIRHERAARLAEALARLPDDMQQVLLGRHVEDLPYAVLAERLGRSEGAVRVLYVRAIRRLRDECRDDT
jgi:RNA polymerase sigma-70 factor (ECF subfamily)